MATDQEIRDAGFKYIPQQKYLQNPFELPENQETVVDKGIVSTDAFTNSGGGGGAFNPYNVDMSTIRQDYNVFPSRQAAEIYSKTFNPKPYGTGVESAQAAYNQANKALALGMDPNSPGYGSFTGGKLTGLKDIANEIIMNNKEQYGAQGQYVNPYDPNYSSMEEAQKFMAHPLFEKYYGVNEKGVQLPGILGVGLEFLKRKMPINERAIMENEARGAGIFTDDIGRIVTDDYNTAGGIMAGYNLNKIDAGTFDKRRSTIEKTIADKKAKGLDTTVLEERLGLLDEAEAEILGARKKTDLIYKMRKDKKDTYEKRKKEEKAAAATTTAAKTTDVKDTSGGYAGTPGGNTGDPGGNFANIDNSGKNYGPYSKPSPAPQYTSQDDTRESRRGRYFYGGRVNFKNGGLASIL
jgi:hypothetical protein